MATFDFGNKVCQRRNKKSLRWRTALPCAYYSVGSAHKKVGKTNQIVGAQQSRAPAYYAML